MAPFGLTRASLASIRQCFSAARTCEANASLISMMSKSFKVNPPRAAVSARWRRSAPAPSAQVQPRRPRCRRSPPEVATPDASRSAGSQQQHGGAVVDAGSVACRDCTAGGERRFQRLQLLQRAEPGKLVLRECAGRFTIRRHVYGRDFPPAGRCRSPGEPSAARSREQILFLA